MDGTDSTDLDRAAVLYPLMRACAAIDESVREREAKEEAAVQLGLEVEKAPNEDGRPG